MSIANIETLSRWARELEEREAMRSAVSKPDARRIIARRLRVVPGTLENLVRGRLKDLGFEVANRLRGLVANELEREIARLERDLELARTGGAAVDGDALSAAEYALDQARRLIAEHRQN